ncbi:MAG: hypothetical protein ACD_4C00086G0010 [uncultured bacterium (gcode 4)]|uniref:Uncharacterized protein n=1 Tax=uncultured bacterium (gcode 4) TaxID=1234023 RepID=K2GA36_9BACT|nr:MAG: hypothetical protein ACD_4C00086G0010 [uncultured bacterium (gcode 4)]
MINTELLRLIKEYDIWEEDAIEIARIFEIMTDERKVEILEDWPNIARSIKTSREQIEKEKEILLIQAIEEIEKDLEKFNKTQVTQNTKNEIQKLKNI